ncbi:ABC transporter B family member 20-like, partial [Trifolium medium]|nr:ABC transporter B family member 20-like [Trifolium medium]
EEEMEEMEDIEPPPASVPFSQLFACADRFDWFLMVVGSVAAAAHGTALVVYLHYFAKVIQVPQYPQQDQFHRTWFVHHPMMTDKIDAGASPLLVGRETCSSSLSFHELTFSRMQTLKTVSYSVSWGD